VRFADKTVLVTGAGRGIGRVLGRRFAAEGARVVLADRSGQEREVADEIEREGGSALAAHADVSIADDVAAMVASAGPVGVLVNNAAVAEGSDVLEIDEETWDRELAIDLKSAFLCSRAVLPGMIARGGGAIVNVATVNAFAYFGNEAYSAAKAGLISLTQALAVRYGPRGIRVNAVAPGTIRTPAWDERIRKDPEVLDRLAKWYPLGRVGEPGDVANAVLFLASEDASWITGTVLRVDGGLLAGNAVMVRELLVEDAPET
jgi:meso-butanediol dehydrogenase / (S,S)-butanediol dehydrogenase / diacetyl reductase